MVHLHTRRFESLSGGVVAVGREAVLGLVRGVVVGPGGEGPDSGPCGLCLVLEHRGGQVRVVRRVHPEGGKALVVPFVFGRHACDGARTALEIKRFAGADIAPRFQVIGRASFQFPLQDCRDCLRRAIMTHPSCPGACPRPPTCCWPRGTSRTAGPCCRTLRRPSGTHRRAVKDASTWDLFGSIRCCGLAWDHGRAAGRGGGSGAGGNTILTADSEISRN